MHGIKCFSCFQIRPRSLTGIVYHRLQLFEESYFLYFTTFSYATQITEVNVQWNVYRFFQPPRETELGLKNRKFRKSGTKI